MILKQTAAGCHGQGQVKSLRLPNMMWGRLYRRRKPAKAMISRTLAVPTLLAASVAVPYVATNAPEWSQRLRGAAAAPVPPGGAEAAPANGPAKPATSAAILQGPNATLYPTVTPLEGVPSYSLADVLRMDVTKDWVYHRWARKSTALAELDLFGVRVPLVTGTQLHDLAGSLTYFFGIDGRVQRISFRGRTGDTTQLAALVHQRFGLQAQPTLIAGEQLLQARRGDDVISELRTRPAPVLWSSSPHDSFSVALELQDPATARPLRLEGLPAPAPPTAAATSAAAAAASQSPVVAAPKAVDAKPEPAWKAFFPRSRVPKAQIKSLDQDNLYQ